MRWLIGLLVAVACVAGLALMTRAPERQQMRFAIADLDGALAEGLAANPEVGFLPRAEFTELAIRQDGERLVVEGRARWFSVGAGGYTLPDVHLTAIVPLEPVFWEVRGSGIGIAGVRLMDAERLAHGTTPARPEGEANRDWWEEAIGEMLRRVGPVPQSEGDQDRFRVETIALEGAMVVMTLGR